MIARFEKEQSRTPSRAEPQRIFIRRSVFFVYSYTLKYNRRHFRYTYVLHNEERLSFVVCCIARVFLLSSFWQRQDDREVERWKRKSRAQAASARRFGFPKITETVCICTFNMVTIMAAHICRKEKIRQLFPGKRRKNWAKTRLIHNDHIIFSLFQNRKRKRLPSNKTVLYIKL